jgi:hypothetical protein
MGNNLLRAGRNPHLALACAAVLTLAGCSAEVGGRAKGQAGPGATSALPGGGPLPPDATSPDNQPVAPAPSSDPGLVTPPVGPARGVLRLLTNEEYRNTVRDLLGLPAAPADPLQPETVSEGYRNFSDALLVTGTLGGQYAALARRVAAELTDLQSLAPCAQGAAPAACAETFIRSFGRLAYRRPLTDAEVAAHVALFSGELARSASYDEGIRLLVEAMIQAPDLLYRFELGTPTGQARTLTAHETATLLSYTFTSTLPDAELRSAADANALGVVEREAHARRLLAMAQAKDILRTFVRQWFRVDNLSGIIQKDEQVYPEYTPELWASMAAEANQLIDAVLWEGDGAFRTLMTSNAASADGPLSAFYGSPNDAAPGAPQALTLNPAQRSGLLTRAAVLATHSKLDESFPIARGKLVRTRLLCQKLPSPPADVAMMVEPLKVDPNSTGRERLEAHSSNPSCAGCHALIDPVGFGLEQYDGIGQFRTMDNGLPVTGDGNLIATRDINGPFVGGVELSQKLAMSTEAQDCFSLQAMRWVFGRDTFGSQTDRAVASDITAQVGSGLDMREALIALIKSDSFVVRSAQ